MNFRFLLRHFNDTIKQCAIDIALGQAVNDATIDEIDNLWHDIKTASLLVLENIDTERPKLEMMPSYFGHALTGEMVSVEITYRLGRSVLYYYKICFLGVVHKIRHVGILSFWTPPPFMSRLVTLSATS